MRNHTPGTYKIFRLIITFFSGEIVFVYRGANATYVKTMRRSILRRIIGAFTVLAIIITLSVLQIPSEKEEVDPLLADEVMKNELLTSSKTDYSQPDETGKLTITEHRVKPGENLSVIAGRYGISIDTICGSNNLRSYDFIRSGVLLKIPNYDGIIYRMKKGNRLVSVAKKYRVSLEKILTMNDIPNPDFIMPETILFIPDAKPQNIIPGFMWPTRSRFITCGYGWRRNPFNRRRREFHHGLDIRARYDWIRSSRFGKVTYAGWLGGYGKTVVVAHPGGWKTLYAPLSRLIVKKGQYVKQGQRVGRSGNTGRSTGPHLHFEIIKRGKHKNPYRYLKKGRA